jgi:hypothetical protein
MSSVLAAVLIMVLLFCVGMYVHSVESFSKEVKDMVDASKDLK